MIWSFIFTLFLTLFGAAQPEPGQFIVRMPVEEVANFEQHASNTFRSVAIQQIYPSLNLYRVVIRDNNRVPGTQEWFFEQCVHDGRIAFWSEDRKLTLRVQPDDALWSEQWGMMRIGMDEAWDISTGGVTAFGDTIVVAVLDDGFEISHPDLRKNVWKNHGEIPGDKIDNDGNGFVDDVQGINMQTGSDQHPQLTHGTAVAGIIAAEGNNGIGIAGTNWNVKMLPISGVRNESDAIEAYNYVRQLRATYNATGGLEGAFVVATNLSAGVDNAFPEDHEAWCAVYEDLGMTGVLNIAATTNKSESVDTDGDIPSTCPSEFLIAVTNTDITDQKLLFAGYGPVNVDLAAPGTFTRTTEINGTYTDFASTSAAAPHVAGTVALMYSTPCTTFMQVVRDDPESAALQVRNILLERTDKLPGLQDLVASGGRLNAFGSMLGAGAYCGASTGVLRILKVFPNPGRGPVSVMYQTPDFSPHEIVMYDATGREFLREKVVPPSTEEKVYMLDSQQIPPGIYFITLSKGKERSTIKFIIPN